MKKIIVVAILISLTFVFISCSDEVSTGVTPVYQGMELSKTMDTNLSSRNSYAFSNSFFSFKASYLNEDLSDEEISDDEVLDIVDDLYTDFTSPSLEVYAGVNETLYLTIHVSNPDSFEILSFTLNGVKYQSYQFEDGSNSENLILEVESGDQSGIKEFTLDQIKYVEGTDIKDVIIEGERTIQLGVEYINQPTIDIISEDIGIISASFTVNLTDDEDLIVSTGQSAKLVLYGQDTLIESVDLSPGTNNISFQSLTANTEYHYFIVAPIDMMDGEGTILHVYAKEIFNTENIINIGDVSVDTETVTFDIINSQPEVNGELTSIKLYKDGNLVEELVNLEERTFENLLSNTSYLIECIFTFYPEGEEAYTNIDTYEIRTLAKETPEVSLTVETMSQDSVSFDYVITDPDNVGEVISIDLYKDGVLVEQSDDFENKTFTGLLSNTAYEIILSYQYNLNDGDGDQIITNESGEIPYSYTTSLETVLTDATNYVQLEDEMIVVYDLHMTYDDAVDYANALGGNLLTILTPEKQATIDDFLVDYTRSFWLGGSTNPKGEITWNNGESSDYTNWADTEPHGEEFFMLRAETNQWYGTFKDTELFVVLEFSAIHPHRFRTQAKETPTLEIVSMTPTQSSVSFDYVITDPDNVGEIIGIDLYKDGVLVEQSSDFENKTFTGLLSNTVYDIILSYQYNLNDGEGDQIITSKSGEILYNHTVPLETVLADATNYVQLEDEMIVAYNLEMTYADALDYANALGGNLLTILTPEKQATIEELLIDNTRSFWLGGSLDPYGEITWNTGESSDYTNWAETEPHGEDAFMYRTGLNQWYGTVSYIEHYVILEFSAIPPYRFKTQAKETPTLEIVSMTPTQSSVSFEINIEDPDETGAITAIELYDEFGLVYSTEDSSIRTFDNLIADTIYEIIITYEYDLNDGEGIQTIQTDTYKYAPVFDQEDLPENLYADSIGLWNTSRYMVIGDLSEMDTQTAQAYAESLGGTLAIIHNQYEQDTITSMLADEIGYSSVRIGGVKTSSGTYEWIDGSSMDYTNWLSSGPIGYYGVYYHISLDSWITGELNTPNPILIQVEYQNMFLTQSYEEPMIYVNNILPNESSVSFNLEVFDPSQIATITAIELYHDGLVIDSLEDLEARSFTGLESGQTYQIVVSYYYDLNDENGIQYKTSENIYGPGLTQSTLLEEAELYTTFEGSLILTYRDNFTFAEANIFAEERGGNIITITNSEKQQAILDMLSSTFGYYWLGLELVGDEYIWVTGQTLDYSHWAPTEPHDDETGRFNNDLVEWYGTSKDTYNYLIIELEPNGLFIIE